jgi:hypothetical protein
MVAQAVSCGKQSIKFDLLAHLGPWRILPLGEFDPVPGDNLDA